MGIAKDTITVFSGDFVVGLTAISLNIILSRFLGVVKFGLFATVISILLVAGGIADFGLGTSLVRFSSLYGRHDQDLTESLTAVAFRLMIAAGAVVAGTVFILAGPLGRYLSGGSELVGLVRLIALGVFGTAVTAAILSILQAGESFRKYALVNMFTGGSKFALIIFLLTLHLLNIYSAVLIFALVPLLSLTVGLIKLRPKIPLYRTRSRLPRHVLAKYLHFGKWVILSFLAVSLMTRMDILLLAHFKGSRTVGLYAAALQLSMVGYTLIGSMVRVVLPKVSKLTHKEQFISFIKKSLTFSMIACLLLSPLLFFSKEIILTVYGSKYLGSVGQFKLLFFTFLLIPLFQPVTMIVYALGKPFVMTLTHLTQFVVGVIGNLILIPLYSGYGAAITLLLINLLGTGFLLSYIFFTVNRSEEIILKEEIQFNV